MGLDLSVNGDRITVAVSPDTPLLWVLRDTIGLTGTKYGCGIGECGACTVHLDGRTVRSCQVPIGAVGSAEVTTIEGLSTSADHPLQRAWLDESVPQCGYCQAGQIMTAAALLASTDGPPSEEQIAAVMTRVLCRCGTYQRVREAIIRAAGS